LREIGDLGAETMTTDTPSPTALSGEGAGGAARFDGARGALAVILLRNLLLSVLTLGIYRFWGRTHVRRFVWRHTAVLDDTLEYLGTGGELFIGFLIAVAVLLPIFAIYTGLQFLLLDGPGYALPALEALYYLVLFFLVQVAIHRMRRYRLTRTAWRGVRFSLGGSSLHYAVIAFGYGLLTAATLGLAWPWMRAATLGYFARNARFGSAGISLNPDAVWLFRRWLAVALPLIAAAVLFAALNWNFIGATLAFLGSGNTAGLLIAWQVMAFWPLWLLAVVPIAWIWYRVVEFRHMMACLSIGGAQFGSSIREGVVFGRIAVFLAAIVGVAAALGLLSFQIAGGRDEADAMAVLHSGIVAGAIPLLLLAMFSGIVKLLLLDIPLLQHACETLRISNTGPLEAVVQSAASMPAYGEGAAEALDVGGF